MVRRCAAVDCSSKAVKGSGITFHGFPLKNEQLLAKWVQAARRANWKPTKWSTLCSEHFTVDDFYPCQARTQLREDVVPTIFSFLPAVDKGPLPKIRKPSEVSCSSNDVMIIEVETIGCV